MQSLLFRSFVLVVTLLSSCGLLEKDDKQSPNSSPIPSKREKQPNAPPSSSEKEEPEPSPTPSPTPSPFVMPQVSPYLLGIGEGFTIVGKTETKLLKSSGLNPVGELGRASADTCTFAGVGLTCDKRLAPVDNIGIEISAVSASSSGGYYILALTKTNEVYSWGGNMFGCLGQGPLVQSSSKAMQIPDLRGVKQISAGNAHSLALMLDGKVKAWGLNGSGELGVPADGRRFSPADISGLENIKWVAAGGGFSLGVRDDGQVLAWGLNSQGVLGNGQKDAPPGKEHPTPQPVVGLKNIVKVYGSFGTAFALDNAGDVFVWGSGVDGMIGNGSDSEQLTPIKVTGVSDVHELAVSGTHVLALKKDGSVWAWGLNNIGQIGMPTLSVCGDEVKCAKEPIKVAGLTNIVTIAAGFGTSQAINERGERFAWGANFSGFGDGSILGSPTPKLVP